jgi:hypothetical protein
MDKSVRVNVRGVAAGMRRFSAARIRMLHSLSALSIFGGVIGI